MANLTLDDFKRLFSNRLLPHVEFVGVGIGIVGEKKRQSHAIIRCNIHGEHKASRSFLEKTRCGCPKCGKSLRGIRSNSSAVKSANISHRLYVIEVEVFGASAIKVGITKNSISSRHGGVVSKIFFDESFQGYDSSLIEEMIHRSHTFSMLRDDSIRKAAEAAGTSWGGQAECYKIEAKDKILDFVSTVFNACRNRDS